MTRSLSESGAPTPVRVACLMALASLTACSTFESITSSDKVDYRTQAKQTTGLDVPPDLTQLPKENRPTGPISAAQMAAQPNTQRQAVAAAGAPVALDKAGTIEFHRLGNARWLHSALPPEQVWPQVKSFWQDRGFTIETEDQNVGLMETNWAENKAKLPQDFIRKTLGSLLDSLYSTGERDKYRTRLERNDQGGTDIYVTHRGLVEVYTNSQRDETGWQPRPSDPELEAEMTSRLMLKLGGKEEDAKTMVATAQRPAPSFAEAPRGNAPRSLADVPDQLKINEDFDRAWRRVGQSLDRHGFTIEDRDRKQGLFFLRYADPNQAGKEEPNFFQRLFGATSASTAVRYRVSVKTEGTTSTVMILDDKGQQQTNEMAKRILQLLMEDVR
ncbi:outer membrane protein assembly factor BamC [Roseateles chitinivorans]|uniref:outer membrane protein assembly factor BamC n=1 Tax=Roseateles chitinivorans TaxID=2917965 RepID=UPI003D667AE3